MKIFCIFFFLYTVQAHGNDEISVHGMFPIYSFALGAVVYKDADFPKCIGGFITRDILLTTGQCLFCDQDCEFNVFVYLRESITSEKYEVLKWEINEKYDGTNSDDDIGYVKLKKEIPFHGVLAVPPKKIYGHRLQGYSFTGKYSNGYLSPDFSRVKVISSELCSFTVGSYISESKICAYSESKNNYLHYHEAKPLVVYGEFGRILYGIYNKENINNKHEAKITIYQSIYQHSDWINKNIFNGSQIGCQPFPPFLPFPPVQSLPTLPTPNHKPPTPPATPPNTHTIPIKTNSADNSANNSANNSTNNSTTYTTKPTSKLGKTASVKFPPS